MSSWTDWMETLPLCERCEQRISGSHYHCGSCDSKDTTSMYGHHVGMHIVAGKIVKTEFHHCTLNRFPGGRCELEDA